MRVAADTDRLSGSQSATIRPETNEEMAHRSRAMHGLNNQTDRSG